jgi:hypothetical protein
MQRFDPILSLEFVERMGTADHVEQVVDKRDFSSRHERNIEHQTRKTLVKRSLL